MLRFFNNKSNKNNKNRSIFTGAKNNKNATDATENATAQKYDARRYFLPPQPSPYLISIKSYSTSKKFVFRKKIKKKFFFAVNHCWKKSDFFFLFSKNIFFSKWNNFWFRWDMWMVEVAKNISLQHTLQLLHFLLHFCCLFCNKRNTCKNRVIFVAKKRNTCCVLTKNFFGRPLDIEVKIPRRNLCDLISYRF